MSYIPISPIVVTWSSIYEPPKNTAVYENIFPTPIILDPAKTYGIAIDSIDTYYSFPNIRECYNNRINYYDGTMWRDLYLPTGCYDIATINSTVKTLLGDNKDKITITEVYPQLKCNVNIGENWQIDFSATYSIGKVLGFTGKVYNAGDHLSEEIVNINSTNSIFVNCDLISASYVNGAPASVIYTFFPNVPAGYKIIKELPRLNFNKINKSQINSIKVWLTDQDNNYLNFRDEVITIRFFLGELISQ